MLNITPETFSRVMHRFKEAGLIQADGKELVITNLDDLRNFG